MADAIALPQEMKHLAGRMFDADSHEMIPAQQWVERFGEDVRELAETVIRTHGDDKTNKNSSSVPDFPGDVMEITDAVADKKGSRAPGASDIKRRLEVLDAMGVRRQMMFPTSVGIWATMTVMNEKYDPKFLSEIKGDRSAKAKKWLAAYNEWIVREAQISDRIRPVPVVMGDTVEDLMESATSVISRGIRAIWLPSGALPGGKSPAHPDLEPFWSLLETSNCVLTLHIGTEGKFLEGISGWRDAPAFEGYRALGEFSSDPWYLAHLHLPTQNFLQTMILGGVLVNHPNLRIGAIECGAYWVGSMLNTMDLWHKNLGSFGKDGRGLAEPPSVYFKRNVKVSVFSFEDLGAYIERDGLEDVICFATDYPHVEGGPDMINVMYQKLKRFGPEVIEKFFVSNGAFLLPD